ncbi:hypothetical protein SCHPADRAFT_387900 [Schizopora paradoxa]|uniref:Uncharacterized protein n=1 Tax=Schizopora paradoxa TaxID=27342 RepID=A0A0H2RN28_9AGAM|nr:hypothetical protein SCHPADRAFT_387900 [Schizopora paradoxa]
MTVHEKRVRACVCAESHLKFAKRLFRIYPGSPLLRRARMVIGHGREQAKANQRLALRPRGPSSVGRHELDPDPEPVFKLIRGSAYYSG